MKKINDEFIRLLRIWGDHRAGRVPGLSCLGYPTETAESRLLTSPGRSTARNSGPHYFANKTAKWVEDKLKSLDSRSHNYLWVEYVGALPIDKAIQAMGAASQIVYETESINAHKAAAKLLNCRYYIYT